MLGVIASYVEFMPTFVFPHGFRLNIEADIMCLEVEVLHWVEKFCIRDISLDIGYCTMLYKRQNTDMAVRKPCDPNTSNTELSHFSDFPQLDYNIGSAIE